MINELLKLCEEKGTYGAARLGAPLDDVPNFVLNRNFDRFGQEPMGAAASLLEFNKGVMKSILQHLPMVIFRKSKYDIFGAAGTVVLEQAISYAKEKGLYTIVDTGLALSEDTVNDVIDRYLGQTDIFGKCSRVCEPDGIIVEGFDADVVKKLENACNTYGRSVFLRTDNFDGIKASYSAVLNGYSNIGLITGSKKAEEACDKIKNTLIIIDDYDELGNEQIESLKSKRKDFVFMSKKGIECAFHEGDWNELDYDFATTEASLVMKENLEK